MMLIDRLLRILKRGTFRDSWKQAEYRRLAEAVAPWVYPGRLVDVGCGEGLFTSHVASAGTSAAVIGLDVAGHEDWGRHSRSVRFVVGDASRPPMTSGCADVVLAKDLLHHADDPVAAATWLVRLAKKRVIVIEANAENPIMAFYTRHNGDEHFTDARLAALLEQACPRATWTRSAAVSYPFYLPPVRTMSAVWVWPATLLMIVAFKILRNRAAAAWLHHILARRRWTPPFMIRVLDLESESRT